MTDCPDIFKDDHLLSKLYRSIPLYCSTTLHNIIIVALDLIAKALRDFKVHPSVTASGGAMTILELISTYPAMY